MLALVVTAAFLSAADTPPPCVLATLMTDAELQGLLRELDGLTLLRQKMARLEKLVGARAFTTEQVLALLDPLPRGTERFELWQQLWPFVLDRDALSPRLSSALGSALGSRLGLEQRSLRNRGFTPRVERIFTREDGSGTLVIAPGNGAVGPYACIALHALDEAGFTELASVISAETSSRQRLMLLRAGLKDGLVSATQARALVLLMRYDEEQAEAGLLLRPRCYEPLRWSQAVCAVARGWADCQSTQGEARDGE